MAVNCLDLNAYRNFDTMEELVVYQRYAGQFTKGVNGR
jgi:hypothetical protein